MNSKYNDDHANSYNSANKRQNKHYEKANNYNKNLI